MNQTVERGKTLLVDGPASVVVTSGKVEVFGFTVSGSNKTIVREGKRLPFAVEEKASFNISLGESASVEEIDGKTIPDSWANAFEELMRIDKKPTTAMVLGTVDSGKTSFCTYLINRLLGEGKRVAILDGDIGQSDIGPPCAVSYAFASKPVTDLFSLRAQNAFFVGTTSPSTEIDKVIEGLTMLKEEMLSGNPDFVIVNTDGWIEGEDAVSYKVRSVTELHPDMIFLIRQQDLSTPILDALKDFTTVVVDFPSTVKQRSREKRRSLRELGYIKYLRNARVQSIPIGWLKIEENGFFGFSKTYENTRQAGRIYELLGMKPLRLAELKDRILIFVGKRRWINDDAIKKVEEFTKKKIVVVRKGDEEGLFTALYDSDRKFLGTGILQEVDYERKTLKILTPVSKEISTVALGKVKLDKNLKEDLAFAEEDFSRSTDFRRIL
jgi:polynucleotide 5'-hydroxyl-kinase GRC3/NOL9